MKKIDFDNDSIKKNILQAALPMLAAQILSLLYNIVDRIYIARIPDMGTTALGAVGLCFPIIMLTIAFSNLFGSGGAPLFSIKRGMSDDRAANTIMNTSFTMVCTFAVVFTALCMIFAKPLLILFGASENALKYALPYLLIYLIGTLPSMISTGMNPFINAQGYSTTGMLSVAIGAVANLVLDPLFIFGFNFGIKGAAIATVSAQALSVVFAVVLLIKKKLPFTITKKDLRLNPQCRRFLKIGLPLALQEFLTQISFLALCSFVNRLGLEASSGYGVACKIVNFAMLVPSSLMQSMASFVSQNVGAGKLKRAKQSMFTGIGVGLLFGCLVFVLILLKGDVLAGFFSIDAGVIQKGFDYLKGFAPETLVTAVLFSMIGYFNGNNQTIWVMVQGLIQTLLVRLPMAYFMSIQPDASLTKIGLAAPVSTTVGIILNIGFFLYFTRVKKEIVSEE